MEDDEIQVLVLKLCTLFYDLGGDAWLCGGLVYFRAGRYYGGLFPTEAREVLRTMNGSLDKAFHTLLIFLDCSLLEDNLYLY